MSFFFWLIVSQRPEVFGSPFLPSPAWCTTHYSQHACAMLSPPPFLTWFPIVHVLSELQTWNIISQPDWTPYVQPRTPSSDNYPHTAWCIVAVGQWYREDASCRLTVPQVASRTCVHWYQRLSLVCQTWFEHSHVTVVRKISADLVGLNDSQKLETIPVKSDQLCKQEI